MCKKLVLIPGWVEDALKTSKAPLTTVLELDKLSSIVSKDDVAFYVASHSLLVRKLFPALASSFDVVSLYPYGVDGVVSGNTVTADAFSADELSLFQQSITNISLTLTDENVPLYKAVQILPPAPASAEDKTNLGLSPDEYTFEIFELKDGVAAIRVKRKDASYSFSQQERDAYSDALGFLYRYVKFEDVANLPIFNHYTKLAYQLSTW